MSASGKFKKGRAYFDELAIRDKLFGQQDIINALDQAYGVEVGGSATLAKSGIYIVTLASAFTLKLDVTAGRRYTILNKVDRNGVLTVEGLTGAEVFDGAIINASVLAEVNAVHTKLTLTAAADIGDYLELISDGTRFISQLSKAAAAGGIASAA